MVARLVTVKVKGLCEGRWTFDVRRFELRNRNRLTKKQGKTADWDRSKLKIRDGCEAKIRDTCKLKITNVPGSSGKFPGSSHGSYNAGVGGL